MSGDRWHQLQDIFWQARSLPAAEREAYLQDAAGDDVALIEQVRRMLVAEQTTGILDVPSDLFTPLDQLMDDVPGERVGPYQLAGEIGRGGMGVVYRAYDRRLHRDVALKFLSTPIRDAAAEERFIKEARAASVLDHPHNCPVYDIGKTEKGRLYIAMAYCSGGSLAQRIAAGPLPIAEAVRIAYEVADLLQAAHQAGIIHRDIKPANIAFSDRGDARVLDFGVAVFGHADVQASTPAGTIAYMSPEQLNGAAADSRSDIWALGVVLYEMLTGQRPFTGERDQIRHAILNEDPADVRSLRPDVHPALARVVARALQKNPAQRFAGAREFKDALPAAEYARTPFGGMRKWIAAAALVAAIATSGYFAIRQRGAAPILSENNTVVVLPFRVSSEPALAYLREGMMDLLAAKLTGEGGLRAADPRTVIASGPPELIERDVTRNQALALARKLGAAHVLLGNVVGNANNLVVNATLLDASGRVISTTTVEGAHDNLSPLVDQMVAELLTTSSGEDRHRLASLTSTSLPALRAYLEGQAAYRRGRFREALEKFTEAIDIDSTFALAGLSLDLADGWVGAGTGDRGLRVAWLSRDRLSERDRAFLETAVGTAYPRLPTVTERLEATERALRLSPDRAELWYTLGDLHLHWGRQFGGDDWEARTERAFRRALELDSTFAPPAQHLFVLFARQGRMRDAEAFARMMLAREPAGPTADYIRWRLQPGAPAANGKPLVLDSLATEALTWIALTSFDDGVGVSIGRRALHIRSLRPATEAQRVERLLSLHANALNAGRPGEALAISSMVREVQPDSGYYLRLRVLAGLYGDGDRRAAEQAASALLAMQTSDARTRALNRCVAAQLRSDVAVPETADTALELRACMAVVRVLRARPGTAAWRQAMTRAEELYRAGPLEVYRGEGYVDAIPLVLARQFVANGEPHKALQTLRRRPYFIGWHPYMAASLLEEGRLAEQLGQLHTAQRAYAHYLALRSNPDEPLRAITDSLRQKVR